MSNLQFVIIQLTEGSGKFQDNPDKIFHERLWIITLLTLKCLFINKRDL